MHKLIVVETVVSAINSNNKKSLEERVKQKSTVYIPSLGSPALLTIQPKIIEVKCSCFANINHEANVMETKAYFGKKISNEAVCKM